MEKSEHNPYAPPSTDVETPEGRERFRDMDFKQVKKLWARSVNVTTIGVLLLISALSLVVVYIPAVLFSESMEETAMGVLLLLVAAFLIVASTGILIRSRWGRVVGIVASMMSILTFQAFPIIVGVFGLFAFFGSPMLFGPDRVLHSDLAAEYEIRKAQRRMQRGR